MRKSTKAKSRVMITLPTQFALPREFEGTLGYLDKIESDAPEFIIDTAEVEKMQVVINHSGIKF